MEDYFKRFCSKDRMELLSPIVHDGFKYFTDGAIAVRIKTDESNSPGKRGPQLHDMFKNWRTDLKWIDLALEELPELTDEQRLGESDCEVCHGGGELECNLGHKHECDDCEGTGKIILINRHQIGEAQFNQKYIEMIKDLPASEIIITTNHTMAFFQFTDGQGALMPMLQ